MVERVKRVFFIKIINKSLTLSVIFFYQIGLFRAQVVFQNTLGGDKFEYGYAIQMTPEGGTIIYRMDKKLGSRSCVGQGKCLSYKNDLHRRYTLDQGIRGYRFRNHGRCGICRS